jgi:hypothetical protein
MAQSWYIFPTKALALAAEAEISSLIGCAVVGRNALTGEPDPSACQTERYADPRQTVTGSWAFPVPEDESLRLDETEHPTVEFPLDPDPMGGQR